MKQRIKHLIKVFRSKRATLSILLLLVLIVLGIVWRVCMICQLEYTNLESAMHHIEGNTEFFEQYYIHTQLKHIHLQHLIFINDDVITCEVLSDNTKTITVELENNEFNITAKYDKDYNLLSYKSFYKKLIGELIIIYIPIKIPFMDYIFGFSVIFLIVLIREFW